MTFRWSCGCHVTRHSTPHTFRLETCGMSSTVCARELAGENHPSWPWRAALESLKNADRQNSDHLRSVRRHSFSDLAAAPPASPGPLQMIDRAVLAARTAYAYGDPTSLAKNPFDLNIAYRGSHEPKSSACRFKCGCIITKRSLRVTIATSMIRNSFDYCSKAHLLELLDHVDALVSVDWTSTVPE